MKGEKIDNFKHLTNHHNYPSININQTTKSKSNLLSLKDDTSSNNQVNMSLLTNKLHKIDNTSNHYKLYDKTSKKQKNTHFTETSTSNQLKNGEIKSYVNTNTKINHKIKDFLKSKVQKISPAKNYSANESQLKSCLENYVKNSRKMRNLSVSQQFFKSFNKGLTKGTIGTINNNSLHHPYVSFNDLYKKKLTSGKNSDISSLNNSLNDKIKNNLVSNTVLGNNDRHNKTNSIISYTKIRNSTNSDLKRNLSYLCENNSNLGTVSDIKSNNSNLITKCNSKQKINGETNTNSTPNNLASPSMDNEGALSSPGILDSTRNKISLLKLTLLDLMKNKGNNKKLITELEMLYKNIISQYSSLANNTTPNVNNELELLDFNNIESINNKDCFNQIKMENAQLKKENTELKNKLDMIDKKFDKIIQENENLKKFIEIKSKNFEALQINLLSFEKTLNDLKNNEKSLTVNQNRSAKEIKFKKISKAPSSTYIKKNINPNLPKPINNLSSSINFLSKSKFPSKNSLNSKQSKHKINKSIAIQSTSKLNSKLKYNEIKENSEIYEIDSLNYSQYTIENPKELYYLPTKVNAPLKSQASAVPKLKIKQKENYLNTENANLNSNNKHSTHSLLDELITPHTNTLDKAFVTNDSFSTSEKKVCMDNLNFFHDSNHSFSIEEIDDQKGKRNKSNHSTKPSSKQNFLLNFENLPKADYHKEFISQFEDFSPSWRKECMKMKGFDPNMEN